ncbi:MAG TPA: hypothetical protein PKO38_08960 [Bacillota bacterium]|nr:hypothetical protein [Bacillota bacterium]HOB87802.1 hypothetical protein [Bacillota bacterium]HOP69546.1 hypothetical protein [Bacillota bacterium]HPT34479.1 hypothetical protein [Bacillota bacterium]HPZ65513.1 hypothetical protein [Bacillota bacterium]
MLILAGAALGNLAGLGLERTVMNRRFYYRLAEGMPFDELLLEALAAHFNSGEEAGGELPPAVQEALSLSVQRTLSRSWLREELDKLLPPLLSYLKGKGPLPRLEIDLRGRKEVLVRELKQALGGLSGEELPLPEGVPDAGIDFVKILVEQLPLPDRLLLAEGVSLEAEGPGIARFRQVYRSLLYYPFLGYLLFLPAAFFLAGWRAALKWAGGVFMAAGAVFLLALWTVRGAVTIFLLDFFRVFTEMPFLPAGSHVGIAMAFINAALGELVPLGAAFFAAGLILAAAGSLARLRGSAL